MRRSRSSGLNDALARWNTATGAKKPSPSSNGAGRASEAGEAALTLHVSPPPGATQALVDMTRTQARHLALTFVRNQRGYTAHEVRRTEYIYDLRVVEQAGGHSFVVHTGRELAQLMTHLNDPTLLQDAANGAIVLRTPIFEETFDAAAECMSVSRYTLTARFIPGDGTDDLDVSIEPAPAPSCDLTRMYQLADECLNAARNSALASGERERSRVMAEASRRLRRYQQQDEPIALTTVQAAVERPLAAAWPSW